MRPSSLDTLQGTLAARRNHDAGALDDKLWPRPITSPADDDAQHISQPPGFEGVDVCAMPAPRPAMPPPADDRMELLRGFVLRATAGRLLFSARVLCQRAPLGDHDAWYAVSGDIGGASTTATWRVAEALGDGDIDAAVTIAAGLCDESVAAWIERSRDERARKVGAL